MQKNILHHLEQLVGFNATSNNQSAVLQLLEYCAVTLNKTRLFDDLVLHEYNGVYSLTASTRGTKIPKVLLQGHIDVVPAPDSLKYKVAGDKIVGRGVYDMLFATACYLAFIEKHQSELAKLDIGLMLTGDEELGGFDGVGYLVEQGYGGGVCIVPDAGNGRGDLNVSAKGVFGFTLEVKGRAHHGSRPWEGDGAAAKLVHALEQLAKGFDTSDPFNSTMTIARLEAGDADNKGPSSARARIDIRYTDIVDLRRIEQLTADICQQYNGTLLDIDRGDAYELDVKHPLVRDFVEIYQKYIDHPVTFGHAHGSSDARFFSNRNMPVLMYRPDGGGAHGDEEYLSVSSLMQFYDVLEEYVLKTAKI